MKRYAIGNTLRGWRIFTARSDREAWAKGTRKFRAVFPDSSRAIELKREQRVPVSLEERRVWKIRGPRYDWVTIMRGLSTEKTWPEAR